MINLSRARRPLGSPVRQQDQVYRSSQIAGRLRLTPQQLRQAGISAAYPLTDLEPDLDRCIAEASSLLQLVGAQIATDWLS